MTITCDIFQSVYGFDYVGPTSRNSDLAKRHAVNPVMRYFETGRGLGCVN